MSRIYKYPRVSLDDSIERDEVDASLRLKKKLEKRKQQRKKSTKVSRSFRKLMSFRDKNKIRS